MSIYRALPEPSYYVYTMLCRDGDGPLYVKFGHSRQIVDRLSALRTGCPIPPRWYGLVECGYEHLMLKFEQELHRHFKSRRVRGEWYKFDPDADKRKFNDGIQFVMLHVFDQLLPVTKISAKALEQRAATLRYMFINNKSFRAKCLKHNAEKRAWRELAK